MPRYPAPARLAVLLAILISAWVVGPRFTRDQYELPKHAGLLVALAWLIYSSPAVFAPRRWLAHPALAGLLCCLTLAALFSGARLPALLGYNESFFGLLTWLTYMLLFLAGASLLTAAGRMFPAVVLAAGCGSALYAILQQFGINPFPGELFHHVCGFAGNPDFLAQQMAITIPFALRPALRRNSVLHWICGGALFLALGLSASRTGILAGLAGAGLLVWLARDDVPRRPAAALTGGFLLLACLAGAELLLGSRLGIGARIAALSAPRSFAQARGDIWQTAARAVRARPLIGWGPDGMSSAFPRFAPAHWTSQAGLSTVPRNAHNEPLNLAVVAGISGLGCYLWLLACALRGFLSDKSPATFTAAAGAAACLLHNLFSFGAASTAPLFWLLLGRLSQRPAGEPTGQVEPRFRIAAMAGASILAAFGVIRLAADAYAFWGKEGADHGRPALELAGYGAASRLAPWDALYAVNYAYAHEKAGRYVQALVEYRRGVELAPLSGLNWGSVGRAGYALASASRDRAGMESAFAAMQRSLALAPAQPALYTVAIQAAHELGYAAETRRLLGILERLNPAWAGELRRRIEGN